ncbi:Hypothetical protein PBC10988_32640 [Planctomycetales bacterium 10988]|nr:Hypothetical protein PBC10988_32640 [Planctomycetales bacterium 10988]
MLGTSASRGRVPRRIGWLFLILGIVCLGGVPTSAQMPMNGMGTSETEEAPESPSQKNSDNSAPVIREAEARVFYVPDEEGNLQRVLNFTLKDFDRMLQSEQSPEPFFQQPGFVIEKLEINGKDNREHLLLEVSLSILCMDSGWTQVPLALGETVVRKAETKDKERTILERTEEGYLAWIKGKEEEIVTLQLTLLARVEQVAGESRLSLTLPMATEAGLKLEVPYADAQARIYGRSYLYPPETEQEKTFLQVEGFERELELAWWKPEQQSASLPAVLEVQGAILVHLEGRTVRTEATLTLNSFQGHFKQIRLRLPEHARLAETPVVRSPKGLMAATSSVSEGVLPILEIQLDRETQGPIEVTLMTERLPSEDQPETPLSLGGFEVLGAAHQSGHLGVHVLGDWQLQWEQRRGVWAVETTELPASFANYSNLFGFEYFSQPLTLEAKIVRRQPRVSVEPQYRFTVHHDRVEMEATFQYLVYQVGIRSLELDMPQGWQLHLARLETNPPGLIERDLLEIGKMRPLVLPLRQPYLGRLEVKLRAWRPLEELSQRLTLLLPSPRVNNLGPAAVYVQPADNIELIPRPDEMIGLSRETIANPESSTTSIWQQPPAVYRTAVATAAYVADWHVNPREVSVTSKGTVQIAPWLAKVEQAFTLQVRYEPLDELAFWVPNEVTQDAPLEILLDGQPLRTLTNLDSPESEGRTRIRLPLPSARLGEINVALRYQHPLSPLQPASGDRLTIPLVQADDSRINTTSFRVEATSPLKVELLDDRWVNELSKETRIDNEVATLLLEQKELADGLELGVRYEGAQEGIRIARLWIQSWLSEQSRRDRVCFWLESAEIPLEIELPEGVDRSSVVAFIGGKPFRPLVKNRQLVIEPNSFSDQGQSIELLYSFDTRPHEIGWTRFSRPHWKSNIMVDRVIWELVLPNEEHLWGVSEAFTPEYSWSWQGLLWKRLPTWSQKQLEAWTGARVEAPGVPPSANRYLMSSQGAPGTLTVRIAHRSRIILVASGVCLVLGLLLIYFPQLRSRGLLFAVVLITISLAALFPDASPLFGQAALLGVLLVLMASLLQRRNSLRFGRGVVVRTEDKAPSVVQSASWEASREVEEPDEHASTATASIASIDFPSSQKLTS